MEEIKTIHVTINDDGTTSNGSIFSAIDDENFYLDYIKYTIEIEEDFVYVSSYDKTSFRETAGTANIVSSITYKGNTYEVFGVDKNAFAGCSSIKSVVIGNGVEVIEEYAFAVCPSIKSVVLGNSVKYIGIEAFRSCESLTSINIPESVKNIENWAFVCCTSLTSMTVSEGNPVYDSREGCNAIIETASNLLIAGCQNTIIPESVTSIGDDAFYGCESLTSINIPSGVTSIGNGAFAGSSLTSIDIPNGVTSIEDEAFAECESLTTIICRAENAPELGDDAFGNCVLQSATLYVPASALEAYKAADGWKKFGTILPIEGNEDVINGIENPAAQES